MIILNICACLYVFTCMYVCVQCSLHLNESVTIYSRLPYWCDTDKDKMRTCHVIDSSLHLILIHFSDNEVPSTDKLHRTLYPIEVDWFSASTYMGNMYKYVHVQIWAEIV